MDIKELITKAAKEIMEDKELQKLFTKDPVKALEKILGVDLPDDLLNPIIDGVKAKIAANNISDVAGNLFKKLF